MQNLIVALPYCTADAPAAKRLLEWIRELDSVIDHHHLTLVADAAVPLETKKELDAIGKSIFKSVETIMPKCPAAVNGNYHPAAAVMFQRTAAHIDVCHKWDWLWMEPDCVPLTYGWLDMLAEAYSKSPKRFMGAITPVKQEGLPPTVMFATAIYPNCAHDELKEFCHGKQAFDMAFSNHVVPRAVNTPLIQHIFGTPNDPPRFKDMKMPDDGPNVGTLDNIRKDAVLFHRNKDGSLIELLRKQRGGKPLIDIPPHPEDVASEPLLPTYEIKPEPVVQKRGPGRPPKVYDDSPIT